MSSGSSGGQPPFNKPEQHQLPVFLRSHQVPLLSWLKSSERWQQFQVPTGCGYHGCFSDHPTKQNQQQCMLALHCAAEFFQSHLLMHENVFQCFSTAWKHPCTLVCDPHKPACHLGAYHWDVGRDVYMCMRAYVYREMYVFLLSLLALFVNHRENKQLIKIKSPENSNRLVRVGKQKPAVAGGIDSQAISSPLSTFPRL